MAREPVSYERKIQGCYKKEQARDCLDIGGQQYVDLTGVFIFELPEQGEELLSKSRLSAQECQIHSRRTYRSNLERKIRKGREEQRGGFLAESLVLLSDLPPPGSLPSSRRKFMANCFKRRRGSTWCTKYSTPGLAAYWKQAWSCSRFCDDTEAVSLLSRVHAGRFRRWKKRKMSSGFLRLYWSTYTMLFSIHSIPNRAGYARRGRMAEETRTITKLRAVILFTGW